MIYVVRGFRDAAGDSFAWSGGDWKEFGTMLTMARDEGFNRLIIEMDAKDGPAPVNTPPRRRPSPAPKARDDTLVCAEHGVAMRRREYEGKTWWSHRQGTGWCNYDPDK